MARNSRHNKIIEIINLKEIETQDDLVNALRDAGYDVTQATVSRDIKDLGLIKILVDGKRYKYATATGAQMVSDKSLSIFSSCVNSIHTAMNMVVVKVTSGTAEFVGSVIEGFAIQKIMGVVYGNDTVLIVTASIEDAGYVFDKLSQFR